MHAYTTTGHTESCSTGTLACSAQIPQMNTRVLQACTRQPFHLPPWSCGLNFILRACNGSMTHGGFLLKGLPMCKTRKASSHSDIS